MPRAGLNTEAVIAAAGRLADAGGLGTLTIAALAKALGVQAPSLYAHVGGLADLRSRLAIRGLRELTAAARAATAGRARGDALQALAATYRGFALAHPGVYAAMQRAPVADDAEWAGAGEQLVELILAVLRGYGLKGDEAIHAVRIVRASLHGFVSLEHEGGFALATPLDTTFERLVAMLDGGLADGLAPRPD